MAKRVLSVGNCGFDNSSLRALVHGDFAAELATASDWSDTIAQLKAHQFALVIVNRKLDADGGDGLDIIRELRQTAEYQHVPVMLLSNYPEYQTKAVELGAVLGFGKSNLHSNEARELLAAHLT